MKKVLITGINGLAGSWLAELYLKEKFEVHGTIRQRSNLENISSIKNILNLHYCDVRDSYSISQIVKKVSPNYLHHTSAISYVPISWSNPAETLQTNLIGTLNVLEAVKNYAPNCSIQFCGSSEEYGKVNPSETPIKEINPLRPLSPYGVSKVAADLLCQQYVASYSLKAIVTRAFNNTGPRRPETFICSNFTKQIAEIEKGLKDPIIRVGNLEAIRDFTDVRDTVRGYWLSLQHGKAGEVYNICSGKGRKIREVLDILLLQTSAEIKIELDPDRLRPSDVPILIGENSKFVKETGWRPQIPFEKTLKDTLNYWRGK